MSPDEMTSRLLELEKVVAVLKAESPLVGEPADEFDYVANAGHVTAGIHTRLTEVEKALCLLAEAQGGGSSPGNGFADRISRGEPVVVTVRIWPKSPVGYGYSIDFFKGD